MQCGGFLDAASEEILSTYIIYIQCLICISVGSVVIIGIIGKCFRYILKENKTGMDQNDFTVLVTTKPIILIRGKMVCIVYCKGPKKALATQNQFKHFNACYMGLD